jgi:dodecin
VQRCKVRTRNVARSWEDTTQGAVSEGTKTLRNIRSIYVKEFTAEVDGGKITN